MRTTRGATAGARRFATASLVTGIASVALGWLIGPLGIALGVVASRQRGIELRTRLDRRAFWGVAASAFFLVAYLILIGVMLVQRIPLASAVNGWILVGAIVAVVALQVSEVAGLVVLIELYLDRGAGRGILGTLVVPYAFVWGWRHARRLGLVGPMRLWSAAAVSGLGLSMALVLGVYSGARAARLDAVTTISKQRITSDGRQSLAAISRDGGFVARVARDAGRETLFLTRVADSSTLQIAKPTDESYTALVFGPGGWIYYGSRQGDAGPRAVYRVPALGGKSVKALDDVRSFSFSPDGKFVAFVEIRQREFSLLVAPIDRPAQAVPVLHGARDRAPAALAFSPDGQTLAYVLTDERDGSSDLMTVGTDGRGNRKLTTHRWAAIDALTWPADDRLVMAAQSELAAPAGLWLVSRRDGAVRPVTVDEADYSGLSASADGRLLLSIEGRVAAVERSTGDVVLIRGLGEARDR